MALVAECSDGAKHPLLPPKQAINDFTLISLLRNGISREHQAGPVGREHGFSRSAVFSVLRCREPWMIDFMIESARDSESLLLAKCQFLAAERAMALLRLPPRSVTTGTSSNLVGMELGMGSVDDL